MYFRCWTILSDPKILGRDKRAHVSAHATLLLDNWQSLQKEWKMSASFCKDQRYNLNCTTQAVQVVYTDVLWNWRNAKFFMISNLPPNSNWQVRDFSMCWYLARCSTSTVKAMLQTLLELDHAGRRLRKFFISFCHSLCSLLQIAICEIFQHHVRSLLWTTLLTFHDITWITACANA